MSDWPQVSAVVTLFGRIIDLECVDIGRWLGHTTYDLDGNGLVSLDELRTMKRNKATPFIECCERLGAANMFNPCAADREYALDLRKSDERSVAQMVVILSAEPGMNMLDETYNGMPFKVGESWVEAVPDVGIFCCRYNTPRHSASLALRLPLCRQLLTPGPGRWWVLDEERRIQGENPEEFDESDDDKFCSGYIIDSDGSLVLRTDASRALEARLAGHALRQVKQTQIDD